MMRKIANSYLGSQYRWLPYKSHMPEWKVLRFLPVFRHAMGGFLLVVDQYQGWG